MTPRLLVAWEPRWKNFTECVRPAFARSPGRREGECSTRSLSPRGAMLSAGLHAAACSLLLATVNAPPSSKVRLQERISPATRIEYFAAETFPTIADASGASRGEMGRRSGRTPFRAKQIIRAEALVPRPDLPAEFPRELQGQHTEVLTTLISVTREVVLSAPDVPSLRSVELPLPNRSALAELPADAMPMESPSPANVQTKPKDISNLLTAPIAPPSVATVENPKLPLPPALLKPEVIGAPATPQRRDRFANTPPILQSEVMPPPSQAAVTGRRIEIPAVHAVAAPNAGGTNPTRAVAIPNLIVTGPPSTEALPTLSAKNVGGLINALKPHVLIVAKADTGVAAIPVSGRSGAASKAPGTGSLPGVGIDGAGSGLSRGAGSGEGLEKSGVGAASAWRGRGDSNTIGGLNSRPGPGGTGRAGGARSGISIEGNVVNLGEFTGPTSKPADLGPRRGHSITIVASSNSGGALNRYGTLKADRVYTVYLPVMADWVVMEYAERSGVAENFDVDLVAPEPLKVDLTPELRSLKTVISCVVERDGSLKNIRVLESTIAPLSHKLVQLLAGWRFRPALRGDEPVAVDALLGFQIDTR
jgi:hypothetical protein